MYIQQVCQDLNRIKIHEQQKQARIYRFKWTNLRMYKDDCENNSIFYTMHKFAPAASFLINQNDHGSYHTFCIRMFSAAVSLIISILSCTNESPGR